LRTVTRFATPGNLAAINVQRGGQRPVSLRVCVFFFPQANYTGALALSDFLLSAKAQNFLAQFGNKTNGPGPLFFPVALSAP